MTMLSLMVSLIHHANNMLLKTLEVAKFNATQLTSAKIAQDHHLHQDKMVKRTAGLLSQLRTTFRKDIL